MQQSINELAAWRQVRAYKDLPNGALDNAIGHLQDLHFLLTALYTNELNQQPVKRGGCVLDVDLSKVHVDKPEENEHE